MTKIKISLLIFIIYILFSLTSFIPIVKAQNTDEPTYDINLTQTADVSKETQQGQKKTLAVDNKEILTEVYKIQDGDHIWQLFRERGLLKKRNLPELLAILKKLNASLSNMDLIHPGETLLIPLTVAPVKGGPATAAKGPEAVISLEDLKKIDLENYTVKPGDSLVRIVSSLFDIQEKEINDDYLEMVKKMNPSISNLNMIYPNQKIRLPIFVRQKIRVPIKQSERDQAVTGKGREHLLEVSRALETVFAQIGEEWVQSGQHFIPLQSGGQVNLNADSYPILNLENGARVIVDLYHELPEKMAQLIPASWKSYKVIHLSEKDDLRSALKKILPVCEYHEIYPSGEPLKLRGDVAVTINADWIIQLYKEPSEEPIKVAAITLLENPNQVASPAIKKLLSTVGIKMVEYPAPPEETPAAQEQNNIIPAPDSASALLEALFTLLNYSYTRDQEIPVFESQKSDFNLILKADFLLRLGEQDYILDLSGLTPEALTLLKEHKYAVLSLFDEKDPVNILKKTLEFLKVPAETKPKSLLVADRPEAKNAKINIPGIVFTDSAGQSILATKLALQNELVQFLAQKGYKVLNLNPL